MADILFFRSHWQIEQVTNMPRFFSALEHLLPPGSVLHFEGRHVNRRFLSLLKAHPALELPHKTIGKSPRLSQHALTSSAFYREMSDFAGLIDHRETLFDHLYAYNFGKMLLYFHDAFLRSYTGGDLLLSDYFCEMDVKAFCARMSPNFLWRGPTA